jgi:LmbE family N-acetylglucosaminyl deacetylase
MRIMHIHAHFDDYEFVAAGTFELWKRKLGDDLRARVLVCTDGQAGHHARSRAETGRMRLAEQEASARIGGYELEVLKLPDGSTPRDGGMIASLPVLAGLWKAIRDFEPDYLFCPPLPSDPLAGLHNDHVAVAEAVRRVAYLINVPHAFTPEYPEEETPAPRACKTPVILNVYDGYMFGANGYDLAVDTEEVFEKVSQMTWCHQSQIAEWLPWVGRHAMQPPATIEEWSRTLRARFDRQNRELGMNTRRATEVFTVTAWGEVPTVEQLLAVFPKVVPEASHLERLRQRLARWRQS